MVAKRRFGCSRVTICRKAFANGTLTSGSSSCFRTCPHLPGDALIEFDSRRELGGWIPLRIVLCLFHRRCRFPQWRPARWSDAWWPGGFADVIQNLPHAAGVVDEGSMIRTPRVLPRCSYAAPSGRIGLWQIGQLSGRASWMRASSMAPSGRHLRCAPSHPPRSRRRAPRRASRWRHLCR